MTDQERSVEDLINAHSKRPDELEEFYEALTKATERLRFRLCAECGLTYSECRQAETTHEYDTMTPVMFLKLTIRRPKPSAKQ